MRKGIFITFEGGEGGGKSTQARKLGEVLQAKGYEVLLTREPGGATGAEAIRKLLVEGPRGHWDGMTEALLLRLSELAARASGPRCTWSGDEPRSG